MLTIPLNYTDFLFWLKDETEHYWSQDKSSHEYPCPAWLHGAKWIGLTEEQIADKEEKYKITFTPEHKEFLQILHTIDRKERVYEEYGSETGSYVERSFLRNWLEDDEDILYYLNVVYTDIFEAVKMDRLWFNSWGTRPERVEERIAIFEKLYANAPKLTPVAYHRYQVADMNLEKRPVLSIAGLDIIYYGSDFRHYLALELREYFGTYLLEYLQYDDENHVWYLIETDDYADESTYRCKTKLPDLPFWQSFALMDWTNHANNVNL
jgi:hypothetical protein